MATTEIRPIHLSRRDFKPTHSCNVLADGWISNGHWSLHPSIVANAAYFASDETAAAFLNIRDGDFAIKRREMDMAAVIEKSWRGRKAVAFKPTPFFVSSRFNGSYRAFASEDGQAVYVAQGYIDLVLASDDVAPVLYAPDGRAALCDAIEADLRRRVLMPGDPERMPAALPALSFSILDPVGVEA
jgi:hypothetical protein